VEMTVDVLDAKIYPDSSSKLQQPRQQSRKEDFVIVVLPKNGAIARNHIVGRDIANATTPV